MKSKIHLTGYPKLRLIEVNGRKRWGEAPWAAGGLDTETLGSMTKDTLPQCEVHAISAEAITLLCSRWENWVGKRNNNSWNWEGGPDEKGNRGEPTLSLPWEQLAQPHPAHSSPHLLLGKPRCRPLITKTGCRTHLPSLLDHWETPGRHWKQLKKVYFEDDF